MPIFLQHKALCELNPYALVETAETVRRMGMIDEEAGVHASDFMGEVFQYNVLN